MFHSIIRRYRKAREAQKEEKRKEEFLGKLRNPDYGKNRNTRPPFR